MLLFLYFFFIYYFCFVTLFFPLFRYSFTRFSTSVFDLVNIVECAGVVVLSPTMNGSEPISLCVYVCVLVTIVMRKTMRDGVILQKSTRK